MGPVPVVVGRIVVVRDEVLAPRDHFVGEVRVIVIDARVDDGDDDLRAALGFLPGGRRVDVGPGFAGRASRQVQLAAGVVKGVLPAEIFVVRGRVQARPEVGLGVEDIGIAAQGGHDLLDREALGDSRLDDRDLLHPARFLQAVGGEEALLMKRRGLRPDFEKEPPARVALRPAATGRPAGRRPVPAHDADSVLAFPPFFRRPARGQAEGRDGDDPQDDGRLAGVHGSPSRKNTAARSGRRNPPRRGAGRSRPPRRARRGGRGGTRRRRPSGRTPRP